ncbi:MAG TPA: DUF3465 domain-containing protein, partial [Candidatus Acidoferrum sp.]|nr:DUF3465 domain-containing protein [Candidatus Acidoferrum sp.]
VVRLIAVAASLILVVACGGRDTADDQALHNDIQNGSSGAEVTFDATLLDDPAQNGDHEVFDVKTTTGEILQVDHNTSLAQSVPAHKGDEVIIHGQLYIDPGPRYGVHCTHAHTSSGCPNPGWIEYNNSYYE